MRNIDRLLSFGFSWWILKSLRQLRRRTLMTCLFVAMTALEAPWTNAVEQFGEVYFPIACHADVQKKFDLALAMLHTFSFPAAAKEFTAVSQEDPDCAMAYWGLAATAIGSLYGGRPGPMTLDGRNRSRTSQSHRWEDLTRARLHCHYRVVLQRCGQDRLRYARACLRECAGATPSQVSR